MTTHSLSGGWQMRIARSVTGRASGETAVLAVVLRGSTCGESGPRDRFSDLDLGVVLDPSAYPDACPLLSRRLLEGFPAVYESPRVSSDHVTCRAVGRELRQVDLTYTSGALVRPETLGTHGPILWSQPWEATGSSHRSSASIFGPARLAAPASDILMTAHVQVLQAARHAARLDWLRGERSTAVAYASTVSIIEWFLEAGRIDSSGVDDLIYRPLARHSDEGAHRGPSVEWLARTIQILDRVSDSTLTELEEPEVAILENIRTFARHAIAPGPREGRRAGA